MIMARRKANVLAARALVRSATGNEYWSNFSQDKKDNISKLATSIYNIIFEPENEDIGRSIELPAAGGSYSPDSIRIAIEMVNLANEYRPPRELSEEADDPDGSRTIRYLEKTLAVVKHISGSQPSSLGLHPAVYFWSATGKHNPAAFLAVVAFFRGRIVGSELIEFSRVRANFEEFLVQNTEITKSILGRFGGWTKSVPAMLRYYEKILDGLHEEKNFEEILNSVLSDHTLTNQHSNVEINSIANSRVSRETKNTVRRRQLLESAVRCPICHARLPSTGFSDDHKIRVEDGGRGDARNIQLTHRYCNHGLKEHLTSLGEEAIPSPSFLSAE